MNRSSVFVIILVIVTVSVIGVLGVCRTSKTRLEASRSKIPFVHKTHVENYKIADCLTCHKYDKKGSFQVFPTVADCTACHARNGSFTNTDHMSPRKKTMFDSYAGSDKPWSYRAQQPTLAHYSHKVSMTSYKCASCHADKAAAAMTATLKGDGLMTRCMDCHQSYNMANECTFCHNALTRHTKTMGAY